MIPMLAIMVYTLLVIIGGFAALRLILRNAGNMPAELWLPISFCLGLGIQCLWYSLMLLVTRSCHAWTILVPFLGLLASSWKWGGIERTGTEYSFFQFAEDLRGPNRFLFTMIGMLIFVFLALFFCNALAYPLNSYDGRSIWAFKAKILFYEHTIFGASFTDPLRVHYHRDYPMMIPFAEFTIHSILNEVQERTLRPFFSQFYVFQLLYAYGMMRRLKVPVLVSFIVTLLLCAIPMRTGWAERDGGNLNTGGADFPLALMAMISLTMFLCWWREKQKWQWIMGVVFAGLCLLTKKEGIIVLAVVCGANGVQSLLRRHEMPRMRALAVSTLAVAAGAVAIALPWFACAMELPNFYDEKFGEMFSWEVLKHAPGRAEVVVLNVGKELFSFDRWNAFWICWPIVVLLSILDMGRRQEFYLDVAVIGWAAIYFLVFLVSPLKLNFHVNTAAERLLSHFLPLVLLRIGVYFAPADADAENPMPSLNL